MEEFKKRISSSVYQKLIEANYTSLERILLSNKDNLSKAIDLDTETAEKVIKEAVDATLKKKQYRASEIEDWKRVNTGCISINSVTRGGIPTNRIVEIYGSSGVGKTQFCLQLALMVQLPELLGGLSRGAVYVCTEDVFPSKRLHAMSAVFQLKFRDSLNSNFEDNIYIEHVANYEHLNRCLFQSLPKLLSFKPIGLVIIDSIAGIFRSENVDVNYINRSQDFVNLVTKLIKLSNIYEFAIVMVNQVSDNIETGTSEPCLGLAWSNLVTCRFKINRFNDSKIREFKVIYAPDLPQTSCKFIITKEGISDV